MQAGALARVCPAGTHMKEISIGRVITTERGKGYGKQIMLHAIDAAIEHFGATLIGFGVCSHTGTTLNYIVDDILLNSLIVFDKSLAI